MTQPFQFPNGQLAYSAEDLLQLCEQFPDDGTNYLIREDLEKWLAYIGKEDIAQCAANARQTAQGDRQKLDEFLTKCHDLSSPQSRSIPEETETKPELTPAVETEPTIVEESTPPKTETKSTTPTPTPTSSSTQEKPSFFRMIAKLIVNVLYRNKN